MENTSWPKYYKELLKIGNLDSNVGIATCWTICDEIIKEIPKDLYCLAGQLYTKNGISFMVRNLLLNKKLRFLVLCGQNRGGSADEVLKLWETGKSEHLDREISKEAVLKMVKNVTLINLIGENNPIFIKEKLEKIQQNLPPYGEPEDFKEPENESLNELKCHFPTDPSVFKVRGKTVAETWLKALKTILKFGDLKETDSMKMKEVLNLTAVISEENPDNFFIPDYLGFDEKKVEDYLPQILKKEKIKGLHYTYGNRLMGFFGIDQVEEIEKKLQNDQNAREAVGILFDPRSDILAEHRPCITLIQALRNQNRLNLNVYVRSHDIFGGWPLNAFGMRKLQQKIAKKANLPLGELTFISASAHIYDFNFNEAQKIIEKNPIFNFEEDPRGFFKIETNKEKKIIEVSHFSPDGLLLQKFSEKVDSKPKTALILAKKINEELGVSLVSHALDLGIELQKAESAIRLEIDYVQDQPFLM